MGACRFMFDNLVTDPDQITCSSARAGALGMPAPSAAGSAVAYVAGEHWGPRDQVFTLEIDSVAAGTGVGQATFRWRRGDSGNWEAAGVATASALTELADGLRVKWTSGPGDDFAVGDRWTILATRNFGAAPLLDGDRDSRWEALGCAEQWLQADLGAARRVEALILSDHNLSDAAQVTLAGDDLESLGTGYTSLGQQFGQVMILGMAHLGEGVCLAGTNPGGKILRSVDWGRTWEDLGSPGDQGQVNTIVHLGGGVCLAGTGGGGKILRSVDWGRNWSDLGQLGGESQVFALTDLGGGMALAGTGPGGRIFRSQDWGRSWEDLGPMAAGSDKIRCLAHLGGGVCLAGTGSSQGHILRSSDWGRTWSDLGQTEGLKEVLSLAAGEGGVVVAGGIEGTTGRIIRSGDWGLTWQDIPAVASYGGVYATGHLGGGVFLAGKYGSAKLLRSADAGITWTDLGSQNGQIGIWSILHLGAGVVLLGTSNAAHILRSDPLDDPAYSIQVPVTSPHLVHFLDQTHRYWRLRVSDPINPAGTVRAGQLYLGGAFQPRRNFRQQHTRGQVAGRSVTATDTGKMAGHARNLGQSLSLAFSGVDAADLAAFQAMYRAIHDPISGRLAPVFFTPDAELPADTVYCLPGAEFRWEQVHRGRWSLSLELEEVVGSHV